MTAVSRTKGSVAQENLQQVAAYAYRPLGHFRVEKIRVGDEGYAQALKINSVFRRCCYAVFRSKEETLKQQEAVIQAIKDGITVLSALPRSKFVAGEEVTRLFIDAQRFNQAVEAHHAKIGTVVHGIIERISSSDEALQIELSAVQAAVTSSRAKSVEDLADRPKRVGSHLRYEGDVKNHALEAFRIFLATQAERIGSIFFERCRYFRGGVTEESIRASDAPSRVLPPAPSSYWIGHATCLMSIPLQDQEKKTTKTINVLTDPVEGHLNALLYPRQTKPGRKIEKSPPIHVLLLSHNHLDHYSEETLQKLRSVQPVMVVPKGDEEMVKALGFTNVKEQECWDRVDIDFTAGTKQYHMEITAVPSHHWAGQGFRGAGSAYLGYVIHGAEGGDIYYAGDTARLQEKYLAKLRDRFNIQWMYQPGGPDEARADMESTHQASADSLWMHASLFLTRIRAKALSKQEFLEQSKACKTILMHTSTFKLGKLHADDTQKSIKRVLKALRSGEYKLLKPYEKKVVDELRQFCVGTHWKDQTITDAELADILQETVYVPKIGSRIDFEKDRVGHQGRLQSIATKRKSV